MSMHGANGKGKRKQKGHLAFQVPFLHVLARSHENGTNGGLTIIAKAEGEHAGSINGITVEGLAKAEVTGSTLNINIGTK